MKPYAQTLIEAGIAESRVADIEAAMETLHKALCKLDFRNLRRFTENKGILGQLDMYARHNGVRNVATDIHNIAIHNAYTQIDHDMFPAASDRIAFYVEEMAECQVPGAKMLLRSMATIRRMEVGKRGLSWHAFITSVMESAREYRGEFYDGTGELFIRTSRKYKTSLRMDDEFLVGYARTFFSKRRDRHCSDDGQSGVDLKLVQVSETTCNEKGIARALKDTYDMSGCTCAHDCCGCLSQYVIGVKCLNREHGIWAVKTSWSYNY